MRHDLLIIGAGPAGISAALEARRLGISDIVIVERESMAGGTVRHCGHSGFGLLDQARLMTGPAYAARLRALTAGFDLRLSSVVTALEPGGVAHLSTPHGPQVIEARRILLATGIREKPRAARFVTGARPFGVMTTGALQRFVYLEGRLPCRAPVIIGSELVAFSALLTLRHGGAKPVAMIEPLAKASAGPFASFGARALFGLNLVFKSRLLSIEGSTRVEAVLVEGPEGPRRIACDAVVFTGDWVPEASLMRMHPAGLDRATGGPNVDASYRTSDPQIYAAGNVLYGVRSSGRVALEGRHAGRLLAADLSGRE